MLNSPRFIPIIVKGTCIQSLNDADFEGLLFISVSCHHSESTVKAYAKQTSDHKKQMSDTLNNKIQPNIASNTRENFQKRPPPETAAAENIPPPNFDINFLDILTEQEQADLNAILNQAEQASVNPEITKKIIWKCSDSCRNSCNSNAFSMTSFCTNHQQHIQLDSESTSTNAKDANPTLLMLSWQQCYNELQLQYWKSTVTVMKTPAENAESRAVICQKTCEIHCSFLPRMD